MMVMLWGAQEREEEYRLELKSRKEEFRRKEGELKDWENALEIRENRQHQQDANITQLMKDLSIKDCSIRDMESEINKLKVELDEMLLRAREEHRKEIKVLLVCVIYGV